MTSRLIRVMLFVCAAVFVATTAAACEVCEDMSHPEPGHTHVWCDFPPNNSWGGVCNLEP